MMLIKSFSDNLIARSSIVLRFREHPRLLSASSVCCRQYFKLAAFCVPALVLLVFSALTGCQKHDQPVQVVGVDGAELYKLHCVGCHGVDGKGDQQGAKPQMRLAPSLAWDSARWSKFVLDGHGEMPAFRAKLSTEEMEAVQQYVRTLVK